MANLQSKRMIGRETDFIIVLHNKKEIELEGLGDLFGAIASDYRRFTRGRSIVVARIVTGSLIIVLRDALETVEGAVAVAEFSKLLKRLFGRIRKGAGTASHGRSEVGLKSIERLVKVASETGSKIDMKQVDQFGKVTEIKITPQTARKIRKTMNAATRVPKKLADRRKAEMKDLAGELLRLPASHGKSISEEEAILIRLVVKVFLDAHMERQLEELIGLLSSQGRPQTAEAIRTEMLRAERQKREREQHIHQRDSED